MSDPTVADPAEPAVAQRPLEYVVRCGSMRILGVMKAREEFQYREEVVVRTDRGTEIGTVLCQATSATLDQMEEPTEGRILRRLGDDDLAQWEHIQSQVSDDIAICQKHVDNLKLHMELVDVERILGGERVVVYYIAEQRVDFRQLVRDLAGEFQTRIEMKHIGVRDEAKLLADYGDCGQPICCANFLSKMPPVSMKMAKLQKATLDPTKISGRCGRLKCCLRYEFDTYEELASELPTVGSEILTREGAATVLAHDILSQQLMVNTDDHRRVLIPAADVLQVTKLATEPKPKKRSASNRSKKSD
ncbi:MAG: regulatory iron-sulfur-containing complex subunit RicT [Pirellulaceae bacterium]